MKIKINIITALLMAFMGISAWGMDAFTALLPLAVTSYIFGVTPSDNYQMAPYNRSGYNRLWVDENIPRGELAFRKIEFSRTFYSTNVDVHHLSVDENAQKDGIDIRLIKKFEEEMITDLPQGAACTIKINANERLQPLLRSNGYTCKDSSCVKTVFSRIKKCAPMTLKNESCI